MNRIEADRDRALDARVAASVERLLRPDYDPAAVLAAGIGDEWPGDYPGRLILALSHLARLTPRVEPRLRELIELLPDRLNDRGCLGPVEAGFNEQQLAGHAWLVAGLYAAADHAAHARAGTIAARIVESLYLPLAGRLATYPPSGPGGAADQGGASGSISRSQGDWALSSDTYCVFIALEALVSSYSHDPDPRVNGLIHEFFDLVERDDLVSGGAQLHATMTAARCAAVHARVSGEQRGLDIALRLYERFCADGRTMNDATMNWFGRSDSWTEPCAMVDVQLLARELWRATGDRHYLDDALLVETNALGHAQRPSGGFGLDSVATAGHPLLRSVVEDAAWCCTMRGAVGLVDARLGSLRMAASDRGGAGGAREAGGASGDASTSAPRVEWCPEPALAIESVHDVDVSWRSEHGPVRLRVRLSGRAAAGQVASGRPTAEAIATVPVTAAPIATGAEAVAQDPSIEAVEGLWVSFSAVEAPDAGVRVIIPLSTWALSAIDRIRTQGSNVNVTDDDAVLVLAHGETATLSLPYPTWTQTMHATDGATLVRYLRGPHLLGRVLAGDVDEASAPIPAELSAVSRTLLLSTQAAREEVLRVAFAAPDA